MHYTIGQRRGIGVGGGVTDNNEPLYVIKLDARNNQVIVGPKEALARNIVHVRDVNWLDDLAIGASKEVSVKLRSTTPPRPARVTRTNDGAVITLDESQYGIATGQAAVFYDESRVVGGGWIHEADHKNLVRA